MARSAVLSVREVVTWLAAATVSALVLAFVEQVVHDNAVGPPLAAVVYAARVAVVAALSACFILLLPHVALERGRWRPILLAAVVVVSLGAVPAWREAMLLTSGDGISALPGIPLIRAIVFVGLCAGFLVLFAWHRLRLTREAPRWALPAELALIGAVLYVSSFRLRAYQFLAELLLVPLFVGATTLAVLVLRRLPRWVPAALVALALVATAGHAAMPRDYALARTAMLRNAPMLSHADVRLGLHPPPRQARFELAGVTPDDCRDFARPLAPAAKPSAPPRHVILLTVDALRADVLSLDRAGRPVAPHLRRWAASGISFSRAITPYPATLLALGSALTGLSPAEIALSPRMPPNLLSRLREELPNQLVVLPDSRWFRMPVMKPLLIQGARVLYAGSARGNEAAAAAGAARGAVEASPDAAATTRFIAELAAARQSGRRTLAWLHLFSPHAPYTAHPGFDFGADDEGRYLSEVAHADAQMGRVFSVLRDEGWLRDTLVVFFADHGQALGERGYSGHHVYLDGYLTDVPLVIHAPGLPRAERRDAASLLDVAPTVLSAFGKAGAAGASGRDLLSGPLPEDRAVLAEAFPVRGSRLFELLSEPPADATALRARAERLLSGARMYLPKVSVVTRDHRLIVNRVTGLTELSARSASFIGQQPAEVIDPALRATLLDRLDALSQAQARSAFCRAKSLWDAAK